MKTMKSALVVCALCSLLGCTEAVRVDDDNEGAPGKNKVAICHKGKTKYVPEPAVQGHLKHGDTLGECR